MAMLKFVRREVHSSGSSSRLSEEDIEAAKKGVTKTLNAASDSTESQKRGKYNSYTPEQRAKIGKYAAENGPSRAAKHYTAVWGIHINESTARRLKTEYLKMLKKEILKEKDRGDEGAAPREPIVITSLEPKDRGRPLLLGEELDAAVQEFVNNLRAANGVVNRLVVMGAAEGIISHRDVSKLSSHGGHIEITKSWAKSLLNRMGFVKRRCSTSGKISLAQFDESKDIFLADVAAEILFNDIPESLIINWDQTGLSIVPTGDWTMEKEGAKIVSIAHSDDKRQLTAVLAITASGEYLPPQLLYQGKTPKCHPQVLFPTGWDVWHSENHWSNEITMRRYIDNIIVPFVIKKRKELKLKETHLAVAIFDNFRGQTTAAILSHLKSHNIMPIQLPANCTDKLQPLDISINKPMKDHLKSKFQQWYAQEIKKQLETVTLSQVKVDVSLQVIKSPNANWIISGWQALEKRPEIAINGFKKSGICDVIKL